MYRREFKYEWTILSKVFGFEYFFCCILDVLSSVDLIVVLCSISCGPIQWQHQTVTKLKWVSHSLHYVCTRTVLVGTVILPQFCIFPLRMNRYAKGKSWTGSLLSPSSRNKRLYLKTMTIPTSKVASVAVHVHDYVHILVHPLKWTNTLNLIIIIKIFIAFWYSMWLCAYVPCADVGG